MAVCIKCGKESIGCLCGACVRNADLEALCEEIMEYTPGLGQNELWDKIALDFQSSNNFKNIGFAVAEYLPSPRKEYRKILSLACNSCGVPKNSRKWLYQVYESCKNSDGLSETERNRIRGLVIDALYKDYEYKAADKMAAETMSMEALPKQVYLTVADLYTITRRYDEADELLSTAAKIFENDDDAARRIREASENNGKYREKAAAGKKEYMPNPKENKEEIRQKYVDFVASIGKEVKEPVSTGRSGKNHEAIPKDQYPDPVEIREADFDSFVAFDLETTGVNSAMDAIIEFGAIKVKDGQVVDSQQFTFQEFVKPYKKKISDEVQRLTGITPDDVKDAREMWEVTPDFLDFVGDNVLVGFNCMTFDSKFLVRAGRYSNVIIENKYFDVMKYAGQFKTELGLEGKISLEDLAEKFNIENPNAHRALADAITTAKVYLKLKAMDGGAGTESVDDMLSDIDNW